jgi:hypothetical protein
VRARPRPGSARAALAAAALGALAPAGAADARNLWSDGDRGLSLRTSLKSALVVDHPPEDPALFPEGTSAGSYWRLRLDLDLRPSAWATVAVAYEQRLRTGSVTAALGTGAVVDALPPPWRLAPLDRELASGPSFAWRHELDRANVALHLGRVEATVGRQAVGWGRGVLFGAVDLFAPFSPLEADREWRRGVDAARAEVRLTDRSSAEAVAALGESADDSILAGRLRGYVGEIDAELVGGRRARDVFAGVTSSAAVGDAEVHGELALFRAPGPLPSGGAWGDERLAPKAVLGGSYRFAVGRGLAAFAEYHYSGLGARSPGALVSLLATSPEFVRRYVRGDTQLLGRHAVALLATLELTNEVAGQALALVSPRDGSGVLSPSVTYTLSDAASVQATLYVPWGAEPEGLALGSDYGWTPLSAFLQLRVYD